MTEYELNILRSNQVLDSLDIAINVLDNYKHHSLGQPIALLYKDANVAGNVGNIRLLLAIGKKEGGGDSSYYEVINTDTPIVSTNFKYVSNYDSSSRVVDNVGGVVKGTTLADIYKQTNNGNINLLFDYIFFKEKATPPTIINPSITSFYLDGYWGQSTITLRDIPNKEDFKFSISRGSVSHGTEGDNKPYAGEYTTGLKVYDSNNEEISWSSMLMGSTYRIRLYVYFNIGTNQPLDSEDKRYGSVCTVTQLYKDIKIIIEDGRPVYAGMVYDEVVGFKTKAWSSLTQTQREEVARSLINTPEYKYTVSQLHNKIEITGKGTISDAETNKGRLVVLIPKSLETKLVVEQNRAGSYSPWVMDVSMDITIDGVGYTAYMATSQYAVMTRNNVYRVSIEK